LKHAKTFFILINLGCYAVAFSANLEDLVLKPSSASQVHQNDKQKQCSPKSKGKGDEESRSFKAA
jgi:hypothetical protein